MNDLRSKSPRGASRERDVERRFEPYPRYKTSGVKWLGDVPQHWWVQRSDSVVATSKQQIAPDAFAGREVFHYSIPAVQQLGTGAVENGDDIESAKQVIDEPVVLVSRLNPRKATICRAESHAHLLTLASSEFVALRAKTGDIRFLEYVVSSELFRQRLDSLVQSVTRSHQRARPEEIYRFWGAWPDIHEQRAIAAFLDRETDRIDALVIKKRELVGRLREKRQALISKTMMRGLPPDAARAAALNPTPNLRPTSIEWIGEIPEHWDIWRLRHLSDTITVGVVVNPSSYVSDEGVPFLLGGDVRELRIDTSDCVRCLPETSDGALRKSRLTSGDIVVVRVGYPGVAAVVPPELDGANCASMMIVRKHRRFCSQWLAYAFNSQIGRDQVEIVQYGAAQKQFNISHAVDFSFPVPPLTEQQAIAGFLDSEALKIDRAATRVEGAIKRLEEYRGALITAAVTGTIDVRDLAA